VIISHDKLSPEALQALIEEFVTRDGTDTGYAHKSVGKDTQAVMRQLRQGKVMIVYDPKTETANIVHKEHLGPARNK
jgi:uncharacterized protein